MLFSHADKDHLKFADHFGRLTFILNNTYLVFLFIDINSSSS